MQGLLSVTFNECFREEKKFTGKKDGKFVLADLI